MLTHFANHKSEVFKFAPRETTLFEAEANVVCGKEEEGNVNVSNVVVETITKKHKMSSR
jgi:hypothetical protein